MMSKRLLLWLSWSRLVLHAWRERIHRSRQQKQGIWPATICAELPEVLKAQTLYLWGDEQGIWQVVMICPCGCKETLHMTTLNDDWPSWKIERHSDGTTTLSPSIWRKIGCRSHFFVRRGKIQWC